MITGHEIGHVATNVVQISIFPSTPEKQRPESPVERRSQVALGIALAILAFVAWSSYPQATKLPPLDYISPPPLPVLR